jgi:hypothetical protein
MKYLLSFLFALLVFNLKSFAASPYDCTPKEEYFGPIQYLDESTGQKFFENIIHFEFIFGGKSYYLTRTGILKRKDGTKVETPSLKELAGKHQSYEFMEFNNIPLIDSGFQDFEGYFSTVSVIDLIKGNVLFTLNKCANEDDGFFTYEKKLFYYCESDCKNNSIQQLDESNRRFTKVVLKNACEIAKKATKLTFKPAKVKRTIDPTTKKEYKTSFFPIKVCKF